MTNKFNAFFSVMEKDAGIIFGTGTERVLALPASAVLAGVAALYFAPKIISGIMEGSRTRNASESASSLKNLEAANAEMVRLMQAQAPAAKPKKDM